jgi:hypothetical protein
MTRQQVKERLIDLLWFDSERQYYTSSTHSFLKEDPSLFTFTIDQLEELYNELQIDLT